MSASKPYMQERLECGCHIESPSVYDRKGNFRGAKWRVVERAESCRFHIVGERLHR